MCWFQVIADLEEEKRRHAEDTAEGDDVTCILEKERERLLQQVQNLAQLGVGWKWHASILFTALENTVPSMLFLVVYSIRCCM